MTGAAGDDRLVGEAGDDVLLGGDGNDILEGGLGQDRLSGGAGDDLYMGGRGDDLLEDDSQVSADTYRHEAGDGVDRISDAGGQDSLQLGAGLAADAVVVRRTASGDLVLALADGGQVALAGQYDAQGAAVLATQIEQVTLADGTVWDQARLRKLAVTGGAGADELIGFVDADIMPGGDGNDHLRGLAGDDFLAGGNGDDTLDGGDGDDSLAAGEGDDVFIGGRGDDTLADLGTSSDTYRYARGDGRDDLSDAGGDDTVELGAGISAADLTVRRNSSGDLECGRRFFNCHLAD
jgi:Ca2+-binding RTX toxin-like protein